MKNWNIRAIEAITDAEAFMMQEDYAEINGHDVYFVDFGGYFGFSALVFKDGAHIYYANDYQLHHTGKSKEELKAWYMETLPNKIFDDKDMETVKDYTDYEKKEYFLRNYYIQRIPYETAFHIVHNDEEEKAFDRKVKNMQYNPLSFCYVDKKYEDVVKKQAELYMKLKTAKDNISTDNFDYWKDAFLKEMFNHEYGINWEGDYNVISHFANVNYRQDDSMEGYFKDAGFTETQKRAYVAARADYYRKAQF